jgi:hypothetical protein
MTAFLVRQRTRELGIRLALCAAPSRLVRALTRESLWFTTMGIGLGLVASLAATSFLGSFLYGVTPTDPVAFVAIPALLILTAYAAGRIPAGAATRIDPMRASERIYAPEPFADPVQLPNVRLISRRSSSNAKAARRIGGLPRSPTPLNVGRAMNPLAGETQTAASRCRTSAFTLSQNETRDAIAASAARRAACHAPSSVPAISAKARRPAGPCSSPSSSMWRSM